MSTPELNFKNQAGLTPESQVFIYQPIRALTQNELNEIDLELNRFVNRWNTKPNVHFASYCFIENRFIVIAVNKNMDSAVKCSVDTPANNIIRKIEKKFSIGLLNPMHISYRSGGLIHTVLLSEFKKRFKENQLADDITIFHTGIHRLKDLKTQWEAPLEKSWFNQDFRNPVV